MNLKYKFVKSVSGSFVHISKQINLIKSGLGSDRTWFLFSSFLKTLLFYLSKYFLWGRKSGLVVSGLDSRSKGCGFESCLIQILDGNGLKVFLWTQVLKKRVCIVRSKIQNTRIMYSQTWASDQLRITTTCIQRQLFWSPV